MMKRRFLFLLAIGVSIGCINAQSIDFGGKLGVEYSKRLARSWDLNVASEVKFHQNFTRYDNFKIGAGFDYSFLRKRLNVGADYFYINKLTKDQIYENRHRINLNISYSEKIRQWKLTYRARFQTTFRDELRANYRFNPKIYMRNKFQVAYSLRNKPVKLKFSEEFFWRLDRPDQRIIDRWQTTLGVQYRFDSRNALYFYVRSSNDVQIKERENLFSIGAVYKFKH